MGVIFTVQNITDVVFPTNYYEMPPIEKTGSLSVEEQNIYSENQKGMKKTVVWRVKKMLQNQLPS